jgi:hypothetical protein
MRLRKLKTAMENLISRFLFAFPSVFIRVDPWLKLILPVNAELAP